MKKQKNKPEELLCGGRATAFKPMLVIEELSDLMGRVLTVIDASIPEGSQNKSIKDLIKDKFSQKQNMFNDLTLIEVEEDIGDLDGTVGCPRDIYIDNLVPFDWNTKYRRVYRR